MLLLSPLILRVLKIYFCLPYFDVCISKTVKSFMGGVRKPINSVLLVSIRLIKALWQCSGTDGTKNPTRSVYACDAIHPGSTMAL